MAQRALSMGVVLVLIAMMWVHTLAQPNCTPTIMSLAPCLGFITGNSSTPSSSCCTQLAGVVQTQAQCLCTVLNGAPQLPFVVNQTQALTLPGVCKIQTPPISQCKASTPTAGSPQGAPSPASSTTPSAATTPSASPSVPTPTTPSTPSVPSTGSTTTPSVPNTRGSGSKTVPTTGESSSASTKFASSILLSLFLASVLSSF